MLPERDVLRPKDLSFMMYSARMKMPVCQSAGDRG